MSTATTRGDGGHVGWIGTGRMGSAMVRRLLAARPDIDVAVWNRTRSKAEPLTAAGATVAEKLADLADRDVVFTTVAADADLLAVTVGEGGLFSRGRGPAYLIDSSTVSVETSELVRAAGLSYGTTLLAAPVSGNAKVARAGKLSIAVSGPSDAYGAVVPLLAAIGGSVTYIEIGRAHV